MSILQCVFCGEGANHYSTNFPEASNVPVAFVDCKICGKYYITTDAAMQLRSEKQQPSALINCVAENVKAKQLGRFQLVWAWRSQELKFDSEKLDFINLDEVMVRPIRHSEKPDRLLEVAAKKLSGDKAFAQFTFSMEDMYSVGVADVQEAHLWIMSLRKSGLLQMHKSVPVRRSEHLQEVPCSLTLDGWRRIEQRFHGLNSRRVFIAMSFDHVDRKNIQTSIEKACEAAGGWEAFTIDHKDYNGGITDEVIASINQSAFIVAEFSENRQGVYFEAGYALGLQKPVIYVVNKNHIGGSQSEGKRLHFDTRHYNHVVWESYSELEERLKNRIEATINRPRPLPGETPLLA